MRRVKPPPPTPRRPSATEVEGTVPATEPVPTEPGSVAATTPATDAPAVDAVPAVLSFSAAEAAGIDVEWGERCDTTTGRLAVVDYFASECYAPFTGDNGGETEQGVTADTVKIVLYQGPEDDFIIRYITDALSIDETNQQEADTVRGMIDYFEAYYETYGRSVELIPYESSGIANDEVTARADAVRIAEEIQPFMVWGGPALTNAFADELAARGVLCLACTPAQPPDWYTERDPFVLGIDASGNQKQSHTAEFILQAAGRQAGRVRRRRRPLDGAPVRPACTWSPAPTRSRRPTSSSRRSRRAVSTSPRRSRTCSTRRRSSRRRRRRSPSSRRPV